MRKSGRCESKEGKQQDCSIARATRGLGKPSLDARSLAQPCYLPEENHWPLEGERDEQQTPPARQDGTPTGRAKHRRYLAIAQS